MSTVSDEIETELSDNVPAEPERIALRSSLPAMELPDFSSFDSKVELPRESFADLLPKSEPARPSNRIVETVSVDAPTIAELDVAYFPNRAMLPELVLLTAVSAAWILGVMPFLPAWWQSWEVYSAIPGAHGLFVMVRWFFYFMGGGYRLTNQQLLRVNAGPIPDPPPIDLRTIASIKMEASVWQSCLCVGQLKLSFERDSQPEVTVGPVGWPRRRKIILEKAIESAREGAVVGSRSRA